MAAGEAPVVAAGLHWDPIPLSEIEAARERLHGVALRTPLVRLDVDEPGVEIFLKLECLQPVRSFKLRGAYNAMAKAGRAALADGVWTVSSGNMAQAVAWSARALGVPSTVYVPNNVPRTKLANIVRYGGMPVELPLDELGPIFLSRHRDGAPGRFVPPYSDPDVMAGNGVIGLEILEDLPEVDAVVAPFGGGGSSAALPRRSRRCSPRPSSTPARSIPAPRSPPRSRPDIRSRCLSHPALSTALATRS